MFDVHDFDNIFLFSFCCFITFIIIFNPLTRPGKNFSLQYQYNVNQVSDENKEKYQYEDNNLIQY